MYKSLTAELKLETIIMSSPPQFLIAFSDSWGIFIKKYWTCNENTWVQILGLPFINYAT